MKRLNGKVAVITGGNSGIGLATAKDFIAEGASVIITGRNKEAINKAVNELGNDAYGIVSDTGDITQLNALRAKVFELFPKIDILFINAGIGKFAPIEQVDEDHFDEQFSINVKGAYFTIQQLLPLINDGGSIILNTSISAHIGMANSSVYSATKAALDAITISLSKELGAKNIRINSILPGATETEGSTNAGVTAGSEYEKMFIAKTPLGRRGQPEDIAKVAVFLASDDAAWITGDQISVSGGMYGF